MRTVAPRFSLILVLAVVSVWPRSSDAAVITAVDSGWWSSGGFHDSANKNYFVGGGFGLDDRNFFVFNLAGVTGMITSATLRLENPRTGYSSLDPTETYSLFDVSTPIGVLTTSSGNTLNTAPFNDLGSGVSFGSAVVSASTTGSIVQVALNEAGIAYLQNAVGGLVAIGGALTSFDANPNTVEFLFGDTGASNVRQLDIQASAIPEPAGSALVALAAVLSRLRDVGARRRRARCRGSYRAEPRVV